MLLTGAGCAQNTGNFDATRHTFVDNSRGTAAAIVLTPTQATNLVALIQSAKKNSTTATSTGDLKPRPQRAPSLSINVYADPGRTRPIGQILGFDQKWIVITGDKVINDTNIVMAVYRTVKR